MKKLHGHNFNRRVPRVETCTTPGLVIYDCLNSGCGYSYQEEIPASGHEPKTFIEQTSVDGTTTKNYHFENTKCVNCNTLLSSWSVHCYDYKTVSEGGHTIYHCICGRRRGSYVADEYTPPE